MIAACMSDLHGNLPDLSHLNFDVLLIGGDICPVTNHTDRFQADWLDTIFRMWIGHIKAPVVAVAGNHDFVFDRNPGMVPSLPWTYLQDSGTTLPNGMRAWGSPHQPYFGGWAFNLHQDDFIDELAEKWDMIPADTDVLLLHGPLPLLNTYNGPELYCTISLLLKRFFHYFYECKKNP